MKKYKFQHWRISDIPSNVTVALYGTGELAKVFLKEIEERNDIDIKFYLDSNNSGTYKGKSKLAFNVGESYDVDYIIIASMFWPNIINNFHNTEKVAIYRYNEERFKLSVVDLDKQVVFRRNARAGSAEISKLMINEGAVQTFLDTKNADYKQFFTFSITRHPTIRFLSAYRQYILEDMKLDFRISPGIDFSAILHELDVSMMSPSIDEFIEKYMSLEEGIRDPHFWSQKLHIGSDLDFIGSLEEINNDFEIIKQLSGHYKGYKLAPSSTHSIKKYKLMAGNKTLEKIERIYSEDFKKFDYNSILHS